jgi:hypothetical protein
VKLTSGAGISQLVHATAIRGQRPDAPLDVFGRAGIIVDGMDPAPVLLDTACSDSARDAAPGDGGWYIALQEGTALAVALDSIEGLAARDSLALSISAVRLASRVPFDTVDALRGLPYVVRGAWRFRAGERTGLIALVARNLGLEADPRSEQILVIAEQRDTGDEWTLRHSERRSGSESEIATDDVIALVQMKRTGALVLFLERSGGTAGGQIVNYERQGNVWREALNIRRSHCNAPSP